MPGYTDEARPVMGIILRPSILRTGLEFTKVPLDRYGIERGTCLGIVKVAGHRIPVGGVLLILSASIFYAPAGGGPRREVGVAHHRADHCSLGEAGNDT